MTKAGSWPKDEGLSPFERKFVDEYLIDFDATAAAKRAGSKAKKPGQMGYLLRHRPNVEAAIIAGIKAQRERAKVTADAVIEQYRRIAFTNIKDLVIVGKDGSQRFDLVALKSEHADVIESIEFHQADEPKKGRKKPIETLGKVKRIRRMDALHALDKLGVHLGIFKDDQVVTVPVRFEIHGAPPNRVQSLKVVAQPNKPE